jgi:hypothetical protein
LLVSPPNSFPAGTLGLGYAAAALLFISSLAGSYNAEGANRLGLAGLIGWLGWASWIVAYSIILLRISPLVSR